jgi:hypothetical protein
MVASELRGWLLLNRQSKFKIIDGNSFTVLKNDPTLARLGQITATHHQKRLVSCQ